MKYKKQNATLAFILLGLGSVFAQESPVSASGTIIGSNGNISYTVGQLVYTTSIGSNGSVAQGIQQPYEIRPILGTDNFNINLQMKVYPNPTVNFLSLEINNYDIETMSYQLFDLNGRLITNNKILVDITSINLQQYPAAIYLLKVLHNDIEIKTFKIIKKQ